MSDPTNESDERPPIEALTPEEKEAFLARVRASGGTLTSAEQYALFGPAPEPEVEEAAEEMVEPVETLDLADDELSRLKADFFSDLPTAALSAPRLVNGIIFDFDYTLARPSQSLDALMAQGAQGANAYMRSTGMELPEDFWHHIIDARRFSEEKSEEEREEHIADDAMSFLLQFSGYPASRMDPEVLRRAVDIFYAPEMTAWEAMPGALDLLRSLAGQGYRLAVVANYNCDRVFQRMVDYVGIRPFVDAVICSAAVEYRKPDTRIFDSLLERWDLLPYEVVVVGDSLLHDIQGGIELGALTALVTMETTPQVVHDNEQAASQVQPDARVDHLSALLDVIQEWAKP